MRVKRKTKRTPLTPLQERIKKRQLAEEDWAVLEGLTDTVERLSLALEEKDASLGRLAKYLLGAPTETQRNVLRKERLPDDQEQSEKPNAKGHGRNGAAPIQVICLSLGNGRHYAPVTAGTLHLACGTALSAGILCFSSPLPAGMETLACSPIIIYPEDHSPSCASAKRSIWFTVMDRWRPLS